MDFSVLTYNVLFNRACPHLDKIFSIHAADVVCLQEVDTNEENLKKIVRPPFKLADYSNCFVKSGTIYGVTTFYNTRTMDLVETSFIQLPQSLIELFWVIIRGTNRPRTVLKTEFIHKPTGRKITVYNVHFTHLIATNGIRKKQLKETLRDMDIESTDPIVVAGDFNFPYGRMQFEKIIDAYKLQEATNNLLYTMEDRFLKLVPVKVKLDYILYRGMANKETKKIEIRTSDHYPILSSFTL